jgi:hypothetical protein
MYLERKEFLKILFLFLYIFHERAMLTRDH